MGAGIIQQDPISIHSLRVEGDGVTPRQQLPRQRFQSTPSVWRETRPLPRGSAKGQHFNPLPPCGGRHFDNIDLYADIDFNPLPPCGGRRNAPLAQHVAVTISIHSLRVEGDRSLLKRRWYQNGFQSTPSVWRETWCVRSMSCKIHISIHSLRVEGDAFVCPPATDCQLISIHSLRVEGDER